MHIDPTGSPAVVFIYLDAKKAGLQKIDPCFVWVVFVCVCFWCCLCFGVLVFRFLFSNNVTRE